ncbi:MAG: hypothetical protein IJP27_08260 [Clostridia bacterium]|nr:hypothetical protein [Clostridia bacterium]
MRRQLISIGPIRKIQFWWRQDPYFYSIKEESDAIVVRHSALSLCLNLLPKVLWIGAWLWLWYYVPELWWAVLCVAALTLYRTFALLRYRIVIDKEKFVIHKRMYLKTRYPMAGAFRLEKVGDGIYDACYDGNWIFSLSEWSKKDSILLEYFRSADVSFIDRSSSMW